MADARAIAGRWWFGYGRWDAPYWFIGKEPGGSSDGDAENWLRLGGGAELIDCAEHDPGPRCLWHGPGGALQPTWRCLIAALLAYKNDGDPKPYDKAAVREYQDRRWGGLVGETAVLELSAAAAPDASTPNPDRLAHLEWRLAYLRQRIADHAPRFVLCYGTGTDDQGRSYIDHWNALAGTTLIPGRATMIGTTVFLLERHPLVPGTTTERWMEIGRELRNRVTESPNAIAKLALLN